MTKHPGQPTGRQKKQLLQRPRSTSELGTVRARTICLRDTQKTKMVQVQWRPWWTDKSEYSTENSTEKRPCRIFVRKMRSLDLNQNGIEGLLGSSLG